MHSDRGHALHPRKELGIRTRWWSSLREQARCSRCATSITVPPSRMLMKPSKQGYAGQKLQSTAISARHSFVILRRMRSGCNPLTQNPGKIAHVLGRTLALLIARECVVPSSRRPCLYCGDECATYSMTINDYDPQRRSTVPSRLYWCGVCRKVSHYLDSKASLPHPSPDRQT